MTPESLSTLTLGTLPRHLRQIARWVAITLTVGYTTGLVFVYHTTSLTPKGAEERYRGNQAESMASDTSASLLAPASGIDTSESLLAPADTSSAAHDTIAPSGESMPGNPTPAPMAEEPEMKFEKSFAEMLNITHTHILAMASFMAFTALIFAFTSRPSSRLKSLLIVEPFVAIITSFASMWLMRYVHPSFSYLLTLSSGSMALCFYIMMFLSFRELFGRGGGERG